MATPRKPKDQHLTAIYALSGPDGVPRYIGQSARPKARLQGHLSNASSRRTNKDRWIAGMVKAGHAVQMTILEWTHDWHEAEPRWIAKGRLEGWPLLNIAFGGLDTHFLHTPSARAKCKTPYVRTIRRMAQLVTEAKKEGRPTRLGEMLTKIRCRGFDIRRQYGEAARAQYQQWIADQFADMMDPQRG